MMRLQYRLNSPAFAERRENGLDDGCGSGSRARRDIGGGCGGGGGRRRVAVAVVQIII